MWLPSHVVKCKSHINEFCESWYSCWDKLWNFTDVFVALTWIFKYMITSEMETLCALLALFDWNPPVADGFPSEIASNATRQCFIDDVHFDVIILSHSRVVFRYDASWWRHQMETFSALLALCEGNPPVTGGFPSQRPVTRSFDVFFDLRLNKRLSKHSRRWWFETPSRSLWRHCNVIGCGSGVGSFCGWWRPWFPPRIDLQCQLTPMYTQSVCIKATTKLGSQRCFLATTMYIKSGELLTEELPSTSLLQLNISWIRRQP